jgi:hypothetical protein
MWWKNFMLIAFYLCINNFVFSQVKPLANSCCSKAHAHNDYRHRPALWLALKYNFGSVEVDVFPYRDNLNVAHLTKHAARERTLLNLYLHPLFKLIEKQGVQKLYIDNTTPFYLLIDIKKDPEKALKILGRQLEPFSNLLSFTENGKFYEKAVCIVLTGKTPSLHLINEYPFIFIDGSLAQLKTGQKLPERALWVSSSWGDLPRSKRKAEVIEAYFAELDSLARLQNVEIRLWGGPDKMWVWQMLNKYTCFRIHTDRVQAVAKFLQTKGQTQGN